MRERPILFSAPMINAILEGRKTQTRRVAKVTDAGCMPGFVTPKAGFVPRTIADHICYCPYGKPGDRLWVREAWQHENYPWGPYDPDKAVFYRADYIDDELGIDLEKSRDSIRRRWKPSIHMPRSASRILLEVTNVRVERLNDISEADAMAEGLKTILKDGRTRKYGMPDRDGYPGNDDLGWSWCDWDTSPIFAYKRLWESINGKGSWDLNPYVWIIDFKPI